MIVNCLSSLCLSRVGDGPDSVVRPRPQLFFPYPPTLAYNWLQRAAYGQVANTGFGDVVYSKPSRKFLALLPRIIWGTPDPACLSLSLVPLPPLVLSPLSVAFSSCPAVATTCPQKRQTYTSPHRRLASVSLLIKQKRRCWTASFPILRPPVPCHPPIVAARPLNWFDWSGWGWGYCGWVL